MAYGYTCDWCSKPGKATGDQRDYPQLPKGWAKIAWNVHVCATCLVKGKKAAET